MGKVTTSQGGSLTLREIKAKYGLPAIAAKVQIDQLYPNVKPVRLNGHTDEYPRLRYEGVRFKSVEELARAVDVCFLAATDIEFDSVVRTLNTQEKLPSTSLDVKRIIVGHRRNTLAMVVQPADKRAWRSYGATRDMLGLADSARFLYKVGGVAGRFEIGVVTVLSRGPDEVVLHDWYTQEDIKERQGFPSPTALTFSYEQFEGTVARVSATSGPKEITRYEDSADDPYEWEVAGVFSQRPYHAECTSSRPITEVKQH